MFQGKKNISKLLCGGICLLFGILTTVFFFTSAFDPPKLSKSEILAQFLKMPISFESNMGQTDGRVKFLTSGHGYKLFFTSDAIVVTMKKSQKEQASALSMTFIGANPDVTLAGEEKQNNISNYFKGNNPQKWQTEIPNFAKVRYKNLYSGIDAVFYGNSQHLEYDLCVSPGSSPDNIRLHIDGSQQINLSDTGDLHVVTHDDQEMIMQKPFIYQIVDGNRVAIEGHYTLLANNDIGFSLGQYDTTKSVVIDPILLYSTFLGGSNDDEANGVAVDSNNNVYIVGLTLSNNFPILNAFQPTSPGLSDAFVSKFTQTGTSLALSYSTYLGGSLGNQGWGIAVDNSGNAYIAGLTSSSDFPVMNPFQATLNGGENAFVTKLNPSGSALVYSTYLGGSSLDGALAIAIDSSGNAYVTGFTRSANFPVTPGAFQPAIGGTGVSVFVTKFAPAGNTLVYSTFLGGGGNSFDSGQGIAADSLGNAYVTGYTGSSTFPTTPGAFQTTLLGSNNAFLTKFSPTGNPLVFSTYLGGTSFDQGYAVALDSSNNAYVTGFTFSPDFPVTPGAFQTILGNVGGNPSENCFITKFSLNGDSLVYSTFLGGNMDSGGNNAADQAFGIAVDSTGAAYVTGLAHTVDFPILNAFQTTLNGTQNAFIAKLAPSGSALEYSSYLGGSDTDGGNDVAFDSLGRAYVVGYTSSTNFPTVDPFQADYGGGPFDAFLSVIGDVLPPPPPPPPGPSVFPPTHLHTHQIVNRFLNHTEFIVQLKWDPPSQGISPVKYRIYRNSLHNLIGTVPANQRLKFTDYTLEDDKTYIYYVVSVDQFGNVSTPAVVAVRFD